MYKLVKGKLQGLNLKQRPNLLKVIFNTFWLFADKILRMGVGVFVGIWIARYFEPVQYGVYNYIIAFSALFSILGTLSLDNIIVRELLAKPAEQYSILGTSFVMRIAGSILAILLSVVVAYNAGAENSKLATGIFLCSISFIFQSFYVIDFYFQSQLKSKYSFLSQNIAFVLVTIIKIVLLVKHASLLYFVFVYSFEFLLAATLFVISYKLTGGEILKWKFSKKVAKQLLADSYTLIISSFAIVIYMRIDQVMLKQTLGDAAVGVYSAAIKISEVWYFIPMAIASSMFPTIIKLKTENSAVYQKRLQQMYDFMAMFGVLVSIIISLLSHIIINVLYGPDYSQAAIVLSVTIWTGVIICISTIHTRWLVVENLQKYSLLYSVIGATINVVLNFVLIKKMGIVGPAISTLAAQFLPMLIAFGLKDARGNLIMMLKSLIWPLRAINNIFYSKISKKQVNIL